MCVGLMLQGKLKLDEVKSEIDHFGARSDRISLFCDDGRGNDLYMIEVNFGMMLKVYSWVMRLMCGTKYDGN
jgi:hypothetical protein